VPPRYKDTQHVDSPDITSKDQVSTTIPSSPPPNVEIHLTYKRSNGDNADRVVTVSSTELSFGRKCSSKTPASILI
jgi:hypothetical protein